MIAAGLTSWLDRSRRIALERARADYHTLKETIKREEAERTERRQAEEALRQSEDRFHAVAANLPRGAVFIVDRNLRYLLAAGEALQAAGLNSEDLIGKTIWDALDPTLAASYEPCFRQVLNGKPFSVEHESHDRYYISHGTPLYNDCGEVYAVLVMSYDISDRKHVEAERQQTEVALRESEEKLSLFIKHAPAAMAMFDRELRYLAYSQRWIEDYDLTEPMIGRSHYEVFPEISEAWKQIHQNCLAGAIEKSDDDCFNRLDGSVDWLKWEARPWFNAAGEIGGIVIFAENITDRKLAEAELRQKNAILDVVNQSAPTPIFVKDRQGRIIYANPATLEVLGKSAAEVIGHRDCDLYPNAEDAARVMENDQRIMASGQTEVVEESPDGIRTFLGMKAPYRNEAGEVIGLIGISNDITDRIQIERDRERILQQEQAAREAAEQANRIKDEFLAVLSHELRSPLNPILGWSRLLQKGNLDATKTAQALATIERNAKLQSELIEDLLDVSRILQGKLSLTVSSIDLTAVIRSAVETVQLAAEAKSITVAASLDAEVGTVSGDATRLQQVVWNLLSNAVKFTPIDGRVEVRLEQVDHQAQITVSDNGNGIPANFLPFVFDCFRQESGATTRQFGGLGLGLAIVRHLVELHGGTVTAASAGKGVGATFTVKLPLLKRQGDGEMERRGDGEMERGSSTLPLTGLQILVIDDETDSRDFVAFVLEQAGANVTTAAIASEGFLALTHAPPDVLVSDIGMPEVDGYMLMRQIRALPPEQGGQVKAIALTAYAGDFNQQQALQAGFEQHISKPVEPEALVRAVHALLTG
ncbi:PAS domain-containing protein [Oculatella sp. LEGE 06141]|uniref:PAS domain-containing protein n=1 Tax=Oculatella sp. LEGE 06141 TaxID=1828648 RepID=UPI00403F101C